MYTVYARIFYYQKEFCEKNVSGLLTDTERMPS